MIFAEGQNSKALSLATYRKKEALVNKKKKPAQFRHSSSVSEHASHTFPYIYIYLCFRLADMLLLKEKLTVQVTDINGVQVNLEKKMTKKGQFK